MMKKIIFLSICITVFYYSTQAQHQVGLKTGFRAGSMGILQDPTATAVLPYQWDATVIGASTFIENNIFHVQNMGLLKLRNSNLDISPLGSSIFYAQDESLLNFEELNFELAPLDNASRQSGIDYIEFNVPSKRYYVVTVNQILGPSFVMKLPSFNIGFFTGLRAIAGTTNVEGSYDFDEIRQSDLSDNIPVEPFNITGAAYYEFGVNISKSFELGEGQLTLGTNVKYLNPFQAYKLDVLRPIDIVFEDFDEEIDARSLKFSPSQGEFAYTNKTSESGNSIGRGLGFDMAASYVSYDIKDEVKYKIGASITDIGRLSFFKNVVNRKVVIVDSVTLNQEDYAAVNSVDEIANILDDQLTSGGNNTTDIFDEFELGLPAALHLFGTYAFDNNVYLSAHYSQPLLAKEGNKLTKGTFLSVTPHYETKWFGVYLPLSVYEFSQFRLGLATKIGPLTFGTEDLGSIFGEKSFTGADAYIALKLFPFNQNESNRKIRKVECFKF